MFDDIFEHLAIHPKNLTPEIRSILANRWDDNNELIAWIQTNNIIWGYTPIYRLQDGWPVDIVLRNDVLIDEHRASRWPRVNC